MGDFKQSTSFISIGDCKHEIESTVFKNEEGEWKKFTGDNIENIRQKLLEKRNVYCAAEAGEKPEVAYEDVLYDEPLDIDGTEYKIIGEKFTIKRVSGRRGKGK